MDPKQCFFVNDCCGIIVVPIQMGAGRGSYFSSIIIRVSVCSYLFLLLCLLVDFWITTAPAAFRDRRSARNVCHGIGLGPLRPAILTGRLLATGLRHLGLGTWRPGILTCRLSAAGLSHLGLSTWRPAILTGRLLAAGLGHLGLGTWRPAILTGRL